MQSDATSGRPPAPPAPDLLRAPAAPYDADNAGATDAEPAFADGAFQKLHPNIVTVERLGNLIFAGVVLAGSLVPFVVFFVADGPRAPRPWLILGAGVLLAGAIAILGLLLPRRAYEATRYAVSPYGLEIRRGIWWRHVVDVPRSRVQHTDVQQGPIARSFGLGKLVVYTAGTQHASVELTGLAHARALELRDYLLRGGGGDDAV